MTSSTRESAEKGGWGEGLRTETVELGAFKGFQQQQQQQQE